MVNGFPPVAGPQRKGLWFPQSTMPSSSTYRRHRHIKQLCSCFLLFTETIILTTCFLWPWRCIVVAIGGWGGG